MTRPNIPSQEDLARWALYYEPPRPEEDISSYFRPDTKELVDAIEWLKAEVERMQDRCCLRCGWSPRALPSLPYDITPVYPQQDKENTVTLPEGNSAPKVDADDSAEEVAILCDEDDYINYPCDCTPNQAGCLQRGCRGEWA